VTQSGDFFYLETLPERIVFIGGGYISFEFAHVAARGGAKATILQRSGRVLKGFDHEIVDRLVQASREVGIDVQMNMPLLSVEKTAAGLLVRAGREGEEETFEADIVVHGAGRVPAIEGLDLAAGGVETDRRGIRVNEYLQSVSNPAVYVAGDVNTRGVQLTPVAVRGRPYRRRQHPERECAAADYWVRPERRLHKPAHRVSRAHGRGGEGERDTLHRPRRRPLGSASRIGGINQKHVGYKLLIESDSRRILGAHLIGHHVEEVINIFALAIKHGLTVDDLTLDAIPWAYPSNTYDITPYGPSHWCGCEGAASAWWTISPAVGILVAWVRSPPQRGSARSNAACEMLDARCQQLSFKKDALGRLRTPSHSHAPAPALSSAGFFAASRAFT